MSDNISVPKSQEEIQKAFKISQESIERYDIVFKDQQRRKERLKSEITSLESEIKDLTERK